MYRMASKQPGAASMATQPTTFQFSRKRIQGLKPGERERTVTDTKESGLQCRITKTGHKSFLMKYSINGLQRKMTFGPFGALTVDEARSLVKKAKGDIVRGIDPQAAKDEGNLVPALNEAFVDFLQVKMDKGRSQQTCKFYRNLFNQYVKERYGTRRVHTLTFSHIDALHRSLKGSPYAANRVVAILSSFFGYARKRRWVTENPCVGIEYYPEEARERVLTPIELARLGQALSEFDGNVYVPAAIRLILFLGARKKEILSLAWDDVFLNQNIVRLRKSKTGKRNLYLNAPAREVLRNLPKRRDNPWLIPGHFKGTHMNNIDKTWRKIRDAAGLDNVWLHDLRRTYATIGVNNSESLFVVSKLLGHSSVNVTERAYAFLKDDPLSQSAENIGSQLDEAMSGNLNNIVQLRR